MTPTEVGIEKGFLIGIAFDGAAKFTSDFEGQVDFEIFGTLTIKSGVTVESTFSPLEDPDPVNVHYNVLVKDGGTLALENSSVLIAPDGVRIKDGTLATIYVPGLDIYIPGLSEPIPQVATITGRLYVDEAGIIDITKGSTAEQFGTLKVTQKVEIGGTVNVSINGITSGPNMSQCDSLSSNSTIFFMDTSKLQLAATEPPLDSGRTWDIMKGTEIFHLPDVSTTFYTVDSAEDDRVLRATYDDN